MGTCLCPRALVCFSFTSHGTLRQSAKFFGIFICWQSVGLRSNSTCHQLTRLSDYLTDCLPRGNVSACHTTPHYLPLCLPWHFQRGICMKMKMKITFFLVVCLLTFYTLCVPSEKEKEFHFRCAPLPAFLPPPPSPRQSLLGQTASA